MKLELGGLKIRGSRFRTELRRNFFAQRVVNLWNSLPSEATEATSLNVFTARIDTFSNSKGTKGYGEWAGKWSWVQEKISHDLIE